MFKIEITKSVIIAKREKKLLFVYESTGPVKIIENIHAATV